MKKFALLLVIVAFGATFIAGCPGNKAPNATTNAANAACAPANNAPAK